MGPETSSQSATEFPPDSPLDRCPQCEKLVNRSVNGVRCPFCGDATFES